MKTIIPAVKIALVMSKNECASLIRACSLARANVESYSTGDGSGIDDYETFTNVISSLKNPEILPEDGNIWKL